MPEHPEHPGRPEQQDHYFSADPSVPFERTRIEVTAWGRTLALQTGSGVFARGRLDVGTAVLLREADPPAGPPSVTSLVDLGCGYGVLGLALAAATPGVRVTAVDVNERALLLARENATALRLADRVTASTPEAVDPAATYDEIWSNPPIRIGKAALHDLLLTWLPRLAPGGRAVMVVGKNLGADSLQRWLGEQGWPTSRLASSKGFRVLETRAGLTPADRPRTGRRT